MKTEKTQTAKLLKQIKDEGRKHRFEYRAVLQYYKSIGGEEDKIEMEAIE